MIKRISDKNGWRWYSFGDKRFISVTQVISSMPHPALLNWFKNNSKSSIDKVSYETSRKGSFIHEIIEKDLNGEDVQDLTLFLKNNKNNSIQDYDCSLAFKNWLEIKKQHGFSKILTEEFVISEKHGYAGAFDALLKDNKGQLWLVDFKTGRIDPNNISPSIFWQISAYKNALVEMGKIDKNASIKMACVHIHRDGLDSNFIESNDIDYFGEFLSLLKAFKGFNRSELLSWEYLNK